MIYNIVVTLQNKTKKNSKMFGKKLHIHTNIGKHKYHLLWKHFLLHSKAKINQKTKIKIFMLFAASELQNAYKYASHE